MSQSPAQLQRKVKKPLIEKKRRERINKCLRDLKKLVLNATDADGSRMAAKMEKAEILEMTVAYVSQLHDIRHRQSLTSDVMTGAMVEKFQLPVCDPLQTVASTSDEYRTGFSECLVHVQRFLAEQATQATAAGTNTGDTALPNLLINHLNHFVVESCRSEVSDSIVRSSPPSPDTTLASASSADAPLPSTAMSPPVAARPSVLPRSSFAEWQSSFGLHSLPLFLSPMDVLRRDGDVKHSSSLSSEHEHQRQLRCGVFTTPSAIVLPLPSNSTSPPMHSLCSSPAIPNPDAAATWLSPGSLASADHDVWRPWRPATTTCCDVSNASST